MRLVIGFASVLVLAVAGCGGIAGDDPDPASGPDAGLEPGDTPVSATTCELTLSEDVTNLVKSPLATFRSNGSSCAISVDGEVVTSRLCTGSVPLLVPGVGSHTVTFVVSEGPGGPTECSRQLLIRYPGPCRQEIDFGADGTLDRVDTYDYDDAGRLTAISLDETRDMVPDTELTQEYDDGGRLVGQDIVRSYEGGVSQRLSFYYDDSGKLDRHEVNNGPDGTTDQRASYLYDAAGRVRERRDDTNLDGIIDRSYLYSFDADNRRSRLDVVRNSDGVVVIRNQYMRDDLGHHIGTEQDTDLDGVANNRLSYPYDCW